MNTIYKNYLFNKHYLIAENAAEAVENQFETLFALANLFNIRITEGEKLVTRDMISFVAEQLGENVPEPFYRGFPESVRELSQLISCFLISWHTIQLPMALVISPRPVIPSLRSSLKEQPLRKMRT